MTRERIGTLDGVRGVAILMVLAGHLVQNYPPLDDTTRRWLGAFANSGAGVRLFFVLSGYLITSLLLQELQATNTVSLRRFYWRRALRIFPAFYVYLLAVTLWQLHEPSGITAGTWTAAATFTWNYSFFWVTPPPEGYWNLGHLWTLALEQQFYLVWPVVLLMWKPHRATWIAAGMIAWCPLARIGTYFLFPAQRGMVTMMFHTGADGLMAGCVAALLFQKGRPRDMLERWGAPAALGAGLWLLVFSPFLAETIHGFPLVAGMTLDALAAAWTISWLHLFAPPWARSFFGRGALPALGLISYSLYLWQQIFLSPAGPLGRGAVLPALLGAFGAACLSYWLVEKPCLRWKFRMPVPTPAA